MNDVPRSFRGNSNAARDIAHHLHPYTNFKKHEQTGPLTIVRGRGNCKELDGRSGVAIGELRDGRLRARSPLSYDRLVSGNYYVVVHNNTPTSRPVACGNIYLS